jgi:hypothetical protein
MSLPPALQNKNVQIGVIAVAILVALGFLMTQILGGGGAAPPEAMGSYGTPYGGPPGMPGGPPGAYPGPPGAGGTSVSAYGSDTYGTGSPLAGAAGTASTAKKAGPRPPARKDPFKTPTELMPPPVPIAEQLPAVNNLYVDYRTKELQQPTLEQFVRDTPDPPMRMAGALWGNRVYGVLEINGQTQVVNPGDKVGIYRVERVERDRIVMSRPGRRGRRRVEALLAGNPSLAGQYPTGDAGVPGGPGGYGGPPGGPPGGGSTGGRTGG